MSLPQSTALPERSWNVVPSVPFGIASIPPRSTMRPRSPSWAHLAEGAGQHDELPMQSSSVETSAVVGGASSGSEQLAPPYSTPIETSAAYEAGLLKSDYNMSGSNPSMRLAFRYIVDAPSKDKGGDEVCRLCLCWVNQVGTPFHFRPMKPVPSDGVDEQGNLRGSRQTRKPPNSTDKMMVTENDHIETTFPGHAFVFCRKIEDFDFGQVNTSKSDGKPIVLTEGGTTIFVREKKSPACKSEEEEMAECEGDWEAYLVIGGFRPNVMPKEGTSDSEDEGESNLATDCDSSSSSSSSSFDERELLVQLVTITLCKDQLSTSSKRDDKDMGCGDCALSLPFLRNVKPKHTNAFVSTGNLLDIVPVIKIDVCLTQLDPTPLDTSNKIYEKVVLGSWPCRVEPGCFPSDLDDPVTGVNSLRKRFEDDLRAACAALPPHAREKLQQSTPVWINKSQSYGPKVAPVRNQDGCFHPGADWLVRNGMSAEKEGGVEWFDARHYLTDCDLWGPGGLMLHELSHAWHHIHCVDDYDNEDIKDTYQKAMDEGLYECVGVHGPQGPKCKAYACQDQMEYFAELSVAFLGGTDEKEHNKWFPFNRMQLRKHDPRAYDMLCRMWGVDFDETKE